MSDLILFGVLRMPPELWRDDPLDAQQRHSCYAEAADRIEALERELAEAARKLADKDRQAMAWWNDLQLGLKQIDQLQQQLAASRADALEQITLALGEHIDTPIETIVAQILAIRAEARRSADARAEQRKEDVRLLLQWFLTAGKWLEQQPC